LSGNKEHEQELRVELQRILSILKEQVKPEKVILFGSLATGNVSSSSDIDLLIIQRSKDSIFERVRNIEGLLRRRCAADLIVLTPEEVKSMLQSGNRYLEDILKRGRVLYERAA